MKRRTLRTKFLVVVTPSFKLTPSPYSFFFPGYLRGRTWELASSSKQGCVGWEGEVYIKTPLVYFWQWFRLLTEEWHPVDVRIGRPRDEGLFTVPLCWASRHHSRIHTGLHHFTEIGHIFHNKYIFDNKNTFKVEIWPVSCLNDYEIQDRGL